MATPDYTINFDDPRFTQVKNEEATAIRETQGTYDKMVSGSDSYYQQQIDASKEWANTQSELQQAQTDFAIEKVEQTKAQAKKDYEKEQRGAYTDYQKATNQYGVNAEQQAAQGLQGSGYSESTRTSMYNTYQNRYMAARESYNKAILNYDNSIKEAQLANNAQLAQIAYETLQKQLELSLQGFQYKNQLLLQKQEAVNAQKDRYYQRYRDVLSQINTENSMAEQVRQYNESLAFQKQQAAQQQSNWEREFALAQASAARASSGGSGGSGGGTTSKQTLTEGNSSQSLSNDGQSGAKPVKQTSVTKQYGTGYYDALKSARTLYSVARTNKRQAAETILAGYVAKNTLTEAGVKQILKQIGATK